MTRSAAALPACPSRLVLVFAAGLVGWAGLAVGAPDPYDPPAEYYAVVSGTGASLRSSLQQRLSSPHIVRSYDAARQALAITDRDPANPSNLILVYTGVSVPSTWDSGGTWNREHTWPDSRGLGGSGPDYSDLHMLRPCNPSVNSSRGNMPFGIGAGFYDPNRFGVRFRGQIARTMFYAAVRYNGSQPSTTDLQLVNGFPPSGPFMGDLAAMLEWHYAEPADEFERRRNHFVFSSAANPVYYQGNRNPFVDRPEFVWTIFGDRPNDSVLFVGPGPAADGSSTVDLDLGRVILSGGPAPAFGGAAVTLSKGGTTPTTYEITLTGDALSPQAGPRQAFTSGAHTRELTVGLPTATGLGVLSGEVRVRNTDLTSSGAGRGSADGDDVLAVQGVALAPSAASFLSTADADTFSVAFGSAGADDEPIHVPVSIYNLPHLSGFTAKLDIVGVHAGGAGVGVLTVDLVPTPGILPGAELVFTATFDPAGAEPGAYNAAYTIAVRDEGLPGGTWGPSLILHLSGEVVADTVPCAADFDNDGSVTTGDITAFLGAWFADRAAGQPGAGDFDGDGTVGTSDITAFLSAWFAARSGGC